MIAAVARADGDSTVSVLTVCPMCHQGAVVKVSGAEFDSWERGTSIQVAMPDLSENDRERLVTGICPPCWGLAFRVEK